MLTRAGALLVAAGCFAGLLGCVSADVYRVKEQEAQTLLKATEDMQERNRSLIAEKNGLESRARELKKENQGLKDRIEKQNEKIVYLKNRVERLEKEGDWLRERAENLTAEISELNKENQKLAVLSRPENLLRSLGERLGDLQKQVEALSGENEKLKSRQVVVRSKEGKAIGGDGEKVIESGEKPKPVMVSAGQKKEDNNAQQLHERKMPAPSEDREKLSDAP